MHVSHEGFVGSEMDTIVSRKAICVLFQDKGDMPGTSQPNAPEFRPRAADAVMAPAPMPVAGDGGPVLSPRDDAGSIKPLARSPKRASPIARDRAYNYRF